MKVLVKVYAGMKYMSNEQPFTTEMDIEGFEVRKISNEEMIKQGWNKEDLDECGEYLLIKHIGKDEALTYRNSHIDLFRI